MTKSYVDLQVNGYAGVDFNAVEPLSQQHAREVAAALTADGVAKILATVITAPLDQMTARISRLAELIETVPEFGEVVAGIHIEGPFINPDDGFVGAHPRQAVCEASADFAKRLIDAGDGHARMLTLAPEMDPGAKTTRAVSELGLTVAAGHCDASLDQLRAAIDNGLTLFTHLGNGCPAQMPRHDNIIQRVLSLGERLAVSFIADGHHVPTFALANYFRCLPDHQIVIVTDAISAAGLGPGKYQLAHQVVEVDPDGAAWAAGRQHYAGCATTMPQMVDILHRRMGIEQSRIEQWTSINPRRLLPSA